MASTGFSDCRQIVKKSRKYAPALDYNQEFFLAGPHTRQFTAALYGASAIIMSLIIQAAGKDSDIYSFFGFCLFYDGGRLAKSPSYDPTKGKQKNPALRPDLQHLFRGAALFTNAASVPQA